MNKTVDSLQYNVKVPSNEMPAQETELPVHVPKMRYARAQAQSDTIINRLRKKAGLTLEGLAALTGYSVSYLSRIASGDRRLNMDLIKQLSKALGCNKAVLLQDSTEAISLSKDGSVKPVMGMYADTICDVAIRDISKWTEDIEYPMTLPVNSNASTEPGADEEIPADVIGYIFRPVELSDISRLFAIKTSALTGISYFGDNTVLFVCPADKLQPEMTILIVQKGHAELRKIWSVAPNKIQVCKVDHIEEMKDSNIAGTMNTSGLVEIALNKTNNIFRIVGHMEIRG